MTDLIFQIGASKLALSVVLAGAAWAVQRRVRRPALSHALWLLTLGALVVPPLVSIPVLAPEAVHAALPAADVFTTVARTPSLGVGLADWLAVQAKAALVWVWLLGAAGALAWTLVRTLSFRRQLASASEIAPAEVQRLGREIGASLGLRGTPTIRTTRADLSPMVWWAGGPVRVVIPSTLLTQLTRAELRCILSHELAHVRRHDHRVRWLEWLACTVFWWNPVAWWARRRLRAAEEFCCDALAVASLKVEPRAYAGSLLRAIALMTERPAHQPPAFASAAHVRRRGVDLEERLRRVMKIEPLSAPRGLRAALKCGALCLLALGLVYCTDRSDSVFPHAATAPADLEGRLTHDSRAESGSRRLAAALTSHIDSLAADGQLTRDAAESFSRAFVPRLAELGASVDGAVPQEFDIRIRISGRDQEQRFKAASGNLIGLQKALALANGLDPRELFVVKEGALGGRRVHIRGFTIDASVFLGRPDECSVELQDGAGVSRVSCETWREVRIPELEMPRSK